MPAKPHEAPIIGAIASIRENELVTIRAVAAGVTSMAMINSTPVTFMVNKIVTAIISISNASIRESITCVVVCRVVNGSDAIDRTLQAIRNQGGRVTDQRKAILRAPPAREDGA